MIHSFILFLTQDLDTRLYKINQLTSTPDCFPQVLVLGFHEITDKPDVLMLGVGEEEDASKRLLPEATDAPGKNIINKNICFRLYITIIIIIIITMIIKTIVHTLN